MSQRIKVAICAYIIDLYPQSQGSGRGRAPSVPPGTQRLESLARGLALPAFWSQADVTAAFAEANRIWIREAEIEFWPINISRRNDAAPAAASDLWPYFINHLAPRGRGIGAGFVYDLPDAEGGWGGGRVVVVSGEKARAGLPGFAGNLLAHELGHVLLSTHTHVSEPSNLMSESRHPRVVNAGLLTPEQRDSARLRAATI